MLLTNQNPEIVACILAEIRQPKGPPSGAPYPYRKRKVTQEEGVNLLAQLWDCTADDLSHYDVTSEPVHEISMAAKR